MVKIPNTSSRARPAAGPVEVYPSVEAFLSALTMDKDPVEVLSAPVYRTITPGGGNTYIQAGVLLTSRYVNRWIYACSIIAVEASIVGERGRLIYPQKESNDDLRVRQRIALLQQELLLALTTILRTDSRVSRIRQYVTYQVPENITWSRDALWGFPLLYQNGHWSISLCPSEQP